MTSATAKSGSTTIRQSASGKMLTLKGYGALKGEFVVRKGVNLSKPIAAQAKSKPKGSTTAKAR